MIILALQSKPYPGGHEIYRCAEVEKKGFWKKVKFKILALTLGPLWSNSHKINNLHFFNQKMHPYHIWK